MAFPAGVRTAEPDAPDRRAPVHAHPHHAMRARSQGEARAGEADGALPGTRAVSVSRPVHGTVAARGQATRTRTRPRRSTCSRRFPIATRFSTGAAASGGGAAGG